jgi:DNA recombination protein RmuC
MEAWIAGVVAAFVGILVGFWLRGSLAGARVKQLEGDLGVARAELTQAQGESAARAGFEALATERGTALERLREDLRVLAETERTQGARISQLDAELRNERQNLAEKLALLETAKKTLADQFEALAGDILEKKSKTFSEGNQKELGTLLEPLKLQIKEFRERVEASETSSKIGVTKLETLIGTLGNLNQQLTEEARNLSTALRGSSKAQGDWGELIVRNLLEKAGMREGEQFRVQESFEATDSEGSQRRSRPDIVVNLPGGRHLIIDSKVSLNAYTDSANALTEVLRADATVRHLASVRAHVDELAQRRYHKLNTLETPDFVVMFVPIEPAFLEALREDENLWRYAYEKEVLLVGPTTLLFVIRIVDNLWQQELQARGVRDVMARGAELYDKFVNFVSDLEAVGRSLRSADASYSSAMKKLSEGRGNLVRQVEMLKELGVRTAKTIPQGLLDASGADYEELALTGSRAAEGNAAEE